MDSLKRTFNLVHREYILHKKAITVAMLITYAILVFKAVFARYLFAASYFYVNDFTSSLYIFVFIVASISFTEIWKTNSGVLYLMLPASRIEKFTAKIISHIFLPLIAFTVLYVLSMITADGLNVILYGSGHGIALKFINPVFYINATIISSLAFLGSTIFKRYAAAKTMGVFILINALSFLLLFSLYEDSFALIREFQLLIEGSGIDEMLKLEYDLIHTISGKTPYIISFIPLSLIIAYFRFKEAEV